MYKKIHDYISISSVPLCSFDDKANQMLTKKTTKRIELKMKRLLVITTLLLVVINSAFSVSQTYHPLVKPSLDLIPGPRAGL